MLAVLRIAGTGEVGMILAEALVRDRELLLTDEPTAALDRQSRAELMDLVSGLARELGLGCPDRNA